MPDPAAPEASPVKATAGAFDGLYLAGDVPELRLSVCAFSIGGDKVRVIAHRPHNGADDVVTTVVDADFRSFGNDYGRPEMRLEAALPHALGGKELDVQLFAGGSPQVATPLAVTARRTGPVYYAGVVLAQ